jgi:hypothetical protein
MMWIARQVSVLKDATMNFHLDIITDSHESSTILISYNNMVTWLPNVTIDLYFEWFEYWCEDLFWVLNLISFKHKIWDVCKLWSVSVFWKWTNRDLVLNDWIIVCVFIKGCKYGTHNCHWVVFLKHCISFETHLSTLKFVSTKGASKYKFSFSLTQNNVV